MNRREYLAGMAMQGILSTGVSRHPAHLDDIVGQSILVADRLILELDKIHKTEISVTASENFEELYEEGLKRV